MTTPRVWLYPEREWRTLGERRWIAQWDVLRPGADLSDDSREPGEMIDTARKACRTKAAAMRAATRAVSDGAAAFGYAEVYEQAVDWMVEADGIGEWVVAATVEHIG